MLRGSQSDLAKIDRLLIRAIGVALAVLVLAILALVTAYYRERYYHPTVAVVDRDLAAAEEQIRRQPQDVAARLSAASLYVDKGRFDDAIAQAQAVLAVSPDDFRALQILGMAYDGKQDRAQAIAFFERAEAANEHNPMAKVSRQLAGIRFYLGQAYFEDGRLDEAIAELRAASEADRTNADAVRVLGDALLAKGDAVAAVEAYQRAARLVPDFREAYSGLAKAYRALGDAAGTAYAEAMLAYSDGAVASAIAALEALAPSWSDRADLHLGLALAYERSGQRDRALAEYREALRLAPDDFAARQGVGRLLSGR